LSLGGRRGKGKGERGKGYPGFTPRKDVEDNQEKGYGR
jgi:hypothetical protein